MRALLQRVSRADVTIDGAKKSEIGSGLCVFLGVSPLDTAKDVEWLAEKVVNLRIFEDEADKMNLSLLDVRGEILLVSQFTLYADCGKGRRPSWGMAAEPVFANEMYESFLKALEARGVKVGTGVFQAHMLVGIENDGPVTIMIDTKE